MSLGQEVSLVVGWRQGRNLRAARVPIGTSFAMDLRAAATRTQQALGTLRRRNYEPTAHLEEDEAFAFSLDALPTRPPDRRRRNEPEEDAAPQEQASALVNLVERPSVLDEVSADQVRTGRFLFYAATFRDPGDAGAPVVAMVKGSNPGRVARSGRILGLLGDTLTRLDQPVMIFADDFDLLVSGTEIVALREGIVAKLFSDVNVVAAAVPALVERLNTSTLPLAPEALAALQEACQQRRLLARRLQVIVNQPHLATLTPADVVSYLERTGQDPSTVVREGKLVVAVADAETFLDVLDARHYRHGYDNSLRRAERSSAVQQK